MTITYVEKASTSKDAAAAVAHHRANDTRSNEQVVKDHGYDNEWKMIRSYGMLPSKDYDGENGAAVGKKIVEAFRQGDAFDRAHGTTQHQKGGPEAK